MTAADNAVVVNGLSYAYPGGPPVLRGVGFQIAAGECVGLIGPSGAGKSTLLLHLNGLLPGTPSANGASVSVNGCRISRESLRQIRRDVGLIFQDPNDQLFCPTVREDVAFGPLNLGLTRSEIETRIDESLSAVGLSGFEHRSTLRLSDGERKRVCLAGVLACRPSVLALDEPSAGLDPRARRRLSRFVQSYSGTCVIATHDLDLVAEVCSRTIVLDEGQIHADGPAEQILSDGRLMRAHGLEIPLRIQYAVRRDEES